ncbi:MAG: RNA 2',3'-cyclic phosphodiesterase [Desulfobacterota bacterium]|jgi:RNA 2',3'-cyclic 3'-phosphodiesterase|nr:RNA 2',3'-cyclic phosphodiesterase [Thermodesulfobacteriota bacterium]
MIRTFVALPLPDAVKVTLDGAITQLKTRNHGVRWVKPDGLHLTLKFLGDIPEERVAKLSADLDRAASECPRLSLTLSGLGAFPGIKRARVVWAGLAGDVTGLGNLARSIDKMCSTHGIAEEHRPFSGHITLGRLKTPTVVDLGIGPVTGMFMAWEVLLYRSLLTPGGAQYTVLHRSSLGG